MKTYNEILSDVTKTATKIPQSDYLDAGKYRIFDQGKEYSIGFSNDEQGVVTDYPYIIFGDHTRVVKYVDEPCYIGADGVKLLKVINKDFDPRYVYYNILAKPIESQGYARHFKFLKEIQFTEKSFSEQQKIATELDSIQSAIDNKKQQLFLLDEAVKSEFVEMFGDKKFPTQKWDGVFITKTGKLDSNAMVEGGKYPFFTCAKEIFSIDNYAFDQEALLLAGNNAAGKYDVKYYKGKFNAYQRTYVLSLKEDWSYRLFQFQLEDKLLYLKEQSKGINTKFLTLKILQELEFIIPPKELQLKFETFVQQIDKSKSLVKQQIADLQELLDSKMQEYFGE